MQCVFAHACYGVILPQEDQDLINKLLDARRDELDADGLLDETDDVEDLLYEAVAKEQPTLLIQLRERYKAGEAAGLIHTGSEDEHYAGSATSAELWIFGHGCLAFPEVSVPAEFQELAEWHFWVTGDV